ncbi:hypothetical protein C8R43DRAFT_1117314 [Mycena crocata]|nr:hypothetical protein C8R43DRAFT_1117314 [Mycena crocata]
MPILLSTAFQDILRAILDEIGKIEADSTLVAFETSLLDASVASKKPIRRFFHYAMRLRRLREEIQRQKEEQRRDDVANLLHLRLKTVRSPADLQKGERYGQMNWLLATRLSQYHHAQTRTFNHLTNGLHDGEQVERFWARDSAGQIILLKGLGHFDGEEAERAWASWNPASSRTQEMRPGSREDRLDGRFARWNSDKNACTVARV